MELQTAQTQTAQNEIAVNARRKYGSWRKFQGFAYTLINVFAFASNTLIAKFLTHYHPFSLAFFRFQGLFLPALLMLAVCYLREKDKPEDERKPILLGVWPPNQRGNWKNIVLICVRGFTACTSVSLLLYSLRYIHVGDTLVIQAAAPIFTNLLAYFVLNEPSGVFPICMALLSILGVGIISRPPLLTGEEKFDANILVGCLFSFASMLLIVVAIVCLRYIKDVHFTILSFSLGFWGTFQNLGMALIFGVFQFPSGLTDVCLTASLAALVFIAQVALIFALKTEEAGPVTLFRTLDCLVAFALQKIFLNVTVDIYSVLGACLILVGVVSTIARKHLATLPNEHKLRKVFYFVLK